MLSLVSLHRETTFSLLSTSDKNKRLLPPAMATTIGSRTTGGLDETEWEMFAAVIGSNIGFLITNTHSWLEEVAGVMAGVGKVTTPNSVT